MAPMEGLEGKHVHVVCPRVMVSTSDSDGSALKLEHTLFQHCMGNIYLIFWLNSNHEDDLKFSKAFRTALGRLRDLWTNLVFGKQASLQIWVPLHSRGGRAFYDMVSRSQRPDTLAAADHQVRPLHSTPLDGASRIRKKLTLSESARSRHIWEPWLFSEIILRSGI
jgi:hypothetical protein